MYSGSHWNSNSKIYGYLGHISIDVNGKKGPHTLGRDLFKFVLGRDGTLYPDYGLEYSKLHTSWPYWKDRDDRCGKNVKNPNLSGVFGNGCAARLMENGWEFDY